MILTLAFRNLFHDRIRLVVTLVGILFSIVLVAVQLGLYLGARKMIISMIENAHGQLWIVAYGAKSFEEGGLQLTPRERHAALAVPGVAAAVPLIVTFAEWRKPAGGSANVVVVGADGVEGGLACWNVIEGSAAALTAADAVAVDETYLKDLGVANIGDTAQIERGRVRVRAITGGIRSFTMAPYVFTTLNRARALMGVPGEEMTYLLVQTQPGADIDRVRRDILP